MSCSFSRANSTESFWKDLCRHRSAWPSPRCARAEHCRQSSFSPATCKRGQSGWFHGHQRHHVLQGKILFTHLVGEPDELLQQLPFCLPPLQLLGEARQLCLEKGCSHLEGICLRECCVLNLSRLLAQGQAMLVPSLQGQEEGTAPHLGMVLTWDLCAG